MFTLMILDDKSLRILAHGVRVGENALLVEFGIYSLTRIKESLEQPTSDNLVGTVTVPVDPIKVPRDAPEIEAGELLLDLAMRVAGTRLGDILREALEHMSPPKLLPIKAGGASAMNT